MGVLLWSGGAVTQHTRQQVVSRLAPGPRYAQVGMGLRSALSSLCRCKERD